MIRRLELAIAIDAHRSFHRAARAMGISQPSLTRALQVLEAELGAPASAAIVWRAQNSVAVADDAGETLMKLIEVLDDHDDVQNVYGNYELSDALMAKLAG